MKTKSKIPALRFKGFTDAWEERKLEEISDKVTEKNKNSEFVETLTNSAEFGIINQRDFFDKNISSEKNLNGYYIVREDDFVYNPRISNYAPVGPIKRNKLGRTGVMSPLYYVFRPYNIDKKFLEYYFDTTVWHKFMKINGDSGVRADRFAIKDSIFKTMPIPYPSIEEQRKIGKFFDNLNDIIALHQRKCDQTKELKKTMLQKMFPKKGERIPEIRFPEFTDEWEEKKLGEMLTERNVQQVPKEDAPLVSFTVENGVTPKTDRYDREFLVRTDDKKYKYTTFDDIVYNPANLKFGAIARNKFGDAVFSPIYVTLVADKEKVLPIFIERIVTNGNFIQESLRYQEGTVYERMSVKVPDFLSMKISIPSLPEQEAIGTYFQTLDQDIAQIEKKLADLKELKKTLLRQLFV